MGYGGSCGDDRSCNTMAIVFACVSSGIFIIVCLCCIPYCYQRIKRNRAMRARIRNNNAKIANENMDMTHTQKEADKLGNYSVINKSRNETKLDIVMTNKLINDIRDKNYSDWNYEDIFRWILSLNDGLFVQYQDILMQTLKQENVNGLSLNSVYKVDIKFWGINDPEHAQILHQQIQAVVNTK